MITDAHPSVRGGGLLARGAVRGMRNTISSTRSVRLQRGGMACFVLMKAKNIKSLRRKNKENKDR